MTLGTLAIVILTTMSDKPLAPRLPTDLRATRFNVGGRKMVVLSFELPTRAWDAALSKAEAEVARELLAGRSNADIARARGTSARTVANQVARVFRKLGVQGRNQLAARWAQERLPR